jgi:hypothetical protein
LNYSHIRATFAYFFLLTVALFYTEKAAAVLKINGETLVYDGGDNQQSNDQFTNIVKWLVVDPSNWSNGTFQTGTAQQIRSSNLIDPLRKEIFDAHVAAQTIFDFPTLDATKANWLMRTTTISLMDRMHGVNPAIDFAYYNVLFTSLQPNPKNVHIQVSSNLWKIGTVITYYFETAGAPNTTAEQAISALLTAKARTDCSCAISVCVLAGATTADATGFNADNPNGHVTLGFTRLKIDFSTLPQDHHPSMEHNTYPAIDTATPIPGDCLYFKNADYRERLVKEDQRANANEPVLWSGEYVIFMGTTGGVRRYSGLGQFDRATEDFIRGEAIIGYNNVWGVGSATPAKQLNMKFITDRMKRLKVKSSSIQEHN